MIVLLGVPDGRLVDALKRCYYEHVERMRRIVGFDYDLIEQVPRAVHVMPTTPTEAADVAGSQSNGPGSPTRRGRVCRGRAARWLITPQVEWSQAPPCGT